MATSVAQFGVTFNFSADRPVGQFADGSWYVIAPVTITGITPDWDGTSNGAEVNPTVTATQGFDTRTVSYDAAKNVCLSLPYTAAGTQSIVKTIGGAVFDWSYIKTAVVLTVLSSEPSGGGASYFRPPYSGAEKPLIPTSQLQTGLLPTLPSVGTPPTLASVVSTFSGCLRMDHHPTLARSWRPRDAMSGYQPQNTPTLNQAMLRLMLDDLLVDKMPALIQFTQHTLDRAYIIKQGYRRQDNGHNPNHRVLAAWGAVMLNLTDVLAYLPTADGFHEDRYLYDGVPGALWGEPSTEVAYWNYVMGLGGSRSNKDPYSFIDGGSLSGGAASYQNITSQSLKGQALVYKLMPQLAAVCPSGRITTLDEYAQRWVALGSWAVPDPVAPFDGNTGNYAITFGPNGLGSYIAGAGRWPASHGSLTDGGQYRSQFVADVWSAYYNSAETAPTFLTQPSNQTVTEGATATFSVVASGNPSPTYQWRKGGSNISGATGASLTITDAEESDEGSYDCVATNSQGSQTSTAATLTVNAGEPPPDPPPAGLPNPMGHRSTRAFFQGF